MKYDLLLSESWRLFVEVQKKRTMLPPPPLRRTPKSCHCEERSDEAIQLLKLASQISKDTKPSFMKQYADMFTTA